MKRFALAAAVLSFFIGACERHEFEGPRGTKQLNQHHDSHEGHDHEEGGH